MFCIDQINLWDPINHLVLFLGNVHSYVFDNRVYSWFCFLSKILKLLVLRFLNKSVVHLTSFPHTSSFNMKEYVYMDEDMLTRHAQQWVSLPPAEDQGLLSWKPEPHSKFEGPYTMIVHALHLSIQWQRCYWVAKAWGSRTWMWWKGWLLIIVPCAYQTKHFFLSLVNAQEGFIL